MIVSDDFLIVLSFVFFIAAVVFRLLDTSGSVLLKHGIYIESSYPSRSLIKNYISDKNSVILKNKLRKILIIRNVHNFYQIMAVVSFSWVIARNIFFR